MGLWTDHEKALVKLLPDGTRDGAFQAKIGGRFPVRCLLFESADKLVMGGTFESYNGRLVNSPSLRIDADGKLDETFAQLGFSGNDIDATAT